MSRSLRALVLLGAALGLLAAPSVSGAQATPVLRGTVGNAASPDAFEISLKRDDGSPLGHLDPGTYTIVVTDYSTMHNFRLRGPGVNQATVVERVETVTWTVTLADGVYRFFCDPHDSLMLGSFRVGNPPPPPPVTRLSASVGPGFAISLRTAAGARVRRVTAGRYRIVVRDRSRMHNFRLVGPSVRKATGVAFVGTVTWTITLRRGQYRFWCVAHPTRMRGSFRVT